AQTHTAMASITSKPILLTLAANNKVYDTLTTRSGTCTPTGVLGSDVVTCSIGSAAFATPIVGTGKPVTFSGETLGGASASNYSISAAQTHTAMASITSKPILLTLAANNKVYDTLTT